ncbi:MAG: hypothetical protein R3345_09175 [Fulvivirga sp.]|nr:hypothetical protein [Fulvivirga sp.]
MKPKTTPNSRRAFMGTLAAGATVGLSMISEPIEAKFNSELFSPPLGSVDADKINAALKKIGKKKHPVCYDVSAANWWGTIWSNVYYMTNQETGTPAAELGVMNVLRHDGILFSLHDDVVKKYNLAEILRFKNPHTGEPGASNPLYEPKEGFMPMPVLKGIKGLQDMGAEFCTCNMAYKHYSMVVAEKAGKKPEEVYKEFVEAKHPDIALAPSGVWVLGRLASNGIAYIDASVG